jgi:DNA-directed RNA polymerase subunit E'
VYKILEVKERIRVPPDKFGLNLEEAVKTSLEEKLEGAIDKNVGVILSVLSIENIGEGVILAGDGALYYLVEFKILAYLPEQHELIKGDVIDVTEFGVFVRLGPVDGMIHVSQLMDDFVSYDSKNLMFTGKKTKIGLTTRQPGLGALEWYKKEEKKAGEKKTKSKKK